MGQIELMKRSHRYLTMLCKYVRGRPFQYTGSEHGYAKTSTKCGLVV